MESEVIYINQLKNRKRKRSIKKKIFKALFLSILFLFGIIFIIFTFFNNIENRKLLNQILKNVNNNINNNIDNNITNNINDPSLLNPNYKDKDKDIKNRINILKKMTNNDPYIYRHMENCLLNDADKYFCIYHLIYPKKVIGKNRILIGRKSDGCYVLLDDFENIKIAYSFGIANMIQFDDELAKRGIDVYMYDHTISSLPYNNAKFHWSKIGICASNERTQDLKTLEDLMKENGHISEKNMILKMDVEGAEWSSLNEINEDILRQFKYIAIEYHFLEPPKEELYYKVIKKIHKTHQAFYFRCHGRENISPIRTRICKYLEVSYIIREGNKFGKDDSIYPINEFEFVWTPNNNNAEINLNILEIFDFDE